MSYYKDLKSLSLKVEKTLEEYKTARNSDAQLIKWLFLVHFNVDPQEPFDKVMYRIIQGELPPFESITRCRRKIQEAGRNKACESVQAERADLEEDVRDQMKEDW